MKKWCIILVLLLLLTGCGKQDTPVDRPPSLEVGYGDSSIYAQTNAYQWYWKDGRETDSAVVDAYEAHPLCGFVPACGLLRDMMKGICYIEQRKNLNNMKKHLPVLFIAGQEDPVGPYGKGVEQAAKAFKKAGMVNVALKLYPGCRHEILNELNKQEVYEDVSRWLAPYVGE